MVELIKIKQNEKGQQLVSARELWQFLGVGTPFTMWIKRRLTKYKFLKENVDFTMVSLISQSCDIKKGGDKKSLDYILTLDTAKHICLMEDTEKGYEVRNYFMDCEEQLKEIKEIKYNPRLRKMQESVEKIARLEEEMRKIVKELRLEYAILEDQSKRMGDIMEKEGRMQFLEEFKNL